MISQLITRKQHHMVSPCDFTINHKQTTSHGAHDISQCIMESYIQLTPLNNYLSNCVIKLHMKLLTPNLPLSNYVIKLHTKLHTRSFSPRPIAQIASISPLDYQTVKLKIFYFAFTSGACPPLLLQFLRPAQNPPLLLSNLSLPSHLDFSFLFLFFSFFISFINKSIKNSKKEV